MSIAAIESASLSACMRMLSNADVVFGAAAAVRGIFANDYAEDFGVAGRAPQLKVAPSDHPVLTRGMAVGITTLSGAHACKVVTWQPDADGYTFILLESA